MKNTLRKPVHTQTPLRVTQADIAKLAGVSVGVVSAALHGSAKGVIRVSPAVRKKIQEIAKKKGYTPNQAARQLASNKSDMWGILCDPQPSEFNALRLSLLHDAAKAKGHRLVIEYIDGTKATLESSIMLFHSLGIENIICLHHFFPKQHSLVPRLLLKAFNNVVFIDKPKAPGAYYSGLDYEEVGRMLYRTLRTQGSTPGLLLKNRTWYAGPLLAKGFAKERGKDPAPGADIPIWVADEEGLEMGDTFSITDARRALKEWALPLGLSGLAVFNDEGAALVSNALRESGYHIPQDIAVIGQGNSRLCDLVYPTLSSVDIQEKKIINAASEILSKLDEGIAAKSELTSPRLHLRASCPAIL